MTTSVQPKRLPCLAPGQFHRIVSEPLECRSRIRRGMIESLEPRRLLTAFTIEGTPNDDTITVNSITDSGVPYYDVTINGGSTQRLGPGNPAGNFLAINCLGGSDFIRVRDTNFQDLISAYGGVGNDTLSVGSGNLGIDIDGEVTMFELENEGVDSVVIDDSSDDTGPHDDIHISESFGRGNVHADEALNFDGLVEFTPSVEFVTVNLSTQADQVFVDAPQVGITVNLGGGANRVYYGGESRVLFGTVYPMTINAGVNDDWVFFRDSGGGTTGRDYSITPTAVMNQTLSGIEHVMLQTRQATNAAPNVVDLTGKPAGVQTIDLDGGPGGVVNGSATTLSIGQQAAPIDLDSVVVTLQLANLQATIDIWDQDDDTTVDPFLLWTDPPQSQQFSKGAFRLSIASNVTAILFVYAGSTNDDFNVSAVALNSVIQLAGGGGDDVLHSSAPARLDSIYQGALFHFAGGAGNDSVELDDSLDALADGDGAYFLGPDWLAKGATIGYNSDPLVSYSEVEQIRLLADNGPNDITFGSNSTQQMTIIGGGGNDFITNYATGVAALSNYGFAAHVSGGAGVDTLGIVDRVDQLVSEYAVDATAFSFRVGGGARDITGYDATLENLSIDEHDGPATSRLRSKPGALRLTVNGWAGNDAYVVGGGDFDNGWVTGTVTLAGGTGSDSIEFDDRLDTSGAGFPQVVTYALDNLSLTRGSTTFTYGSFESQTLRAADGFTPNFLSNTININAVSIFLDSTTIIGPSTRESSVRVTTNNLVNIAGTLNLQMSAANLDTVHINDHNATANKTYIFTSTQVIAGGLTINHSGVNRLNLQAGSGSDTIALDTIAPGGSVFARGNGGNDTLQLGVADLPANLLGPATVSGDAGTDLLIANSAFGTQFQSAELTSTGYINGFSHAYETVEQVRVIQPLGGSALNIKSVGAPTTVLGGAGNDAITIGNGDFDLNIQADVSVSGGAGNDSILIDDSTDDPGNDSYYFGLRDSGTVGEFMKNYPLGRRLLFTTVDQLNTIGSPQNDSVNFNWTTIPISFDGRGGNDSFFLGNGLLDAIAPIEVVGGSGTDSIMLADDSSEDQANYRVAGNAVTRNPGQFGAFGGLTHETAESLTILGSFTVADTFNVRPHPSTTVTVRGFNPTTATR